MAEGLRAKEITIHRVFRLIRKETFKKYLQGKGKGGFYMSFFFCRKYGIMQNTGEGIDNWMDCFFASAQWNCVSAVAGRRGKEHGAGGRAHGPLHTETGH